MIVTPPPTAGYKLVVRGRVHPARTMDDLAGLLAQAHREGADAQVRACVSLTQDRPLTGDECDRLLTTAADLLTGGA